MNNLIRKVGTYTFFSLFLLLVSTKSHSALFVLKDVLEADERIANQRPSLFISPMTGELIKIKNQWYQIRLFVFETKSSKYEVSGILTFAKMLKYFKLEYMGASPIAEALVPGYYFYPTREVKLAGIYFFLSLRPINDPDIVKKLEKRKLKNKSPKPKDTFSSLQE